MTTLIDLEILMTLVDTPKPVFDGSLTGQHNDISRNHYVDQAQPHWNVSELQFMLRICPLRTNDTWISRRQSPLPDRTLDLASLWHGDTGCNCCATLPPGGSNCGVRRPSQLQRLTGLPVDAHSRRYPPDLLASSIRSTAFYSATLLTRFPWTMTPTGTRSGCSGQKEGPYRYGYANNKGRNRRRLSHSTVGALANCLVWADRWC